MVIAVTSPPIVVCCLIGDGALSIYYMQFVTFVTPIPSPALGGYDFPPPICAHLPLCRFPTKNPPSRSWGGVDFKAADTKPNKHISTSGCTSNELMYTIYHLI